tara:strand:+ start:155 stop:370 length:216 start_codon:yes stop_codon:yes gene_type:complete
MRTKRRNTNLKILQSQLEDLVVDEKKEVKNSDSIDIIKGGSLPKEVSLIVKIKKRGPIKDALISTKLLLTM